MQTTDHPRSPTATPPTSSRDHSMKIKRFVAADMRVLHWTWQALDERPEDLIAELYAVLNRHH